MISRHNLILVVGILFLSIGMSAWTWFRYGTFGVVTKTEEQMADQQRTIEALAAKTEQNEKSLAAIVAQLQSTKSLLNREYELSKKDAVHLSLTTKAVQAELPEKADAQSINQIKDQLRDLGLQLETARTAQEDSRNDLAALVTQNQAQLAELRKDGLEHHEFSLSDVGGETVVCGLMIKLVAAAEDSQQFSLMLRDSKSEWSEKKNWYKNEPIYWYFTGTRDLIEIVISDITANRVAGYVTLSKNRGANACR